MKKIISISFLLFTIIGFSQKGSVLVTYKKDFSIYKINSKNKERQNKLNSFIKGISIKSKSVDFNLKIKDYQSIFSLEKSLAIDNDEMALKFIASAGSSSGDFYINSKTKEIIRNIEKFGETFNITYSIDSLKWKLSNEEKIIGNYKCYKAETIRTVQNSKGTFNHKVVAWYTPELPFSFGPVGYGGLPGLIVELSYQNIKFYVSKIVLNPKKKINIIKPVKGKKITRKEYSTLVKILATEYRKSLSN